MVGRSKPIHPAINLIDEVPVLTTAAISYETQQNKTPLGSVYLSRLSAYPPISVQESPTTNPAYCVFQHERHGLQTPIP